MRCGTENTVRSGQEIRRDRYRNSEETRGRPAGFVTEKFLERVRTVFMEKRICCRPRSTRSGGRAGPQSTEPLRRVWRQGAALYRDACGSTGKAIRRARCDPRVGWARSRSAWAGSSNAIDLYSTAPPVCPGCLIVETAAVEPTHPRIAAVARDSAGSRSRTG